MGLLVQTQFMKESGPGEALPHDDYEQAHHGPPRHRGQLVHV